MKLKLPKQLLLFLLLSCSHIPSIAFAGEVDVTDESIRQEYMTDTTVISSNPSLTYNGWSSSDVLSSSYKGSIFHGAGNLTFKDSYALTITNSSMKSLGGFIASSKILSFDGLSKLSLNNNRVEITDSSAGYSGLLYSSKDMLFTNISEIEIMNNLNSVASSGNPHLVYSSLGPISFDNVKKITISHNQSRKITSNSYGGIVSAFRGGIFFSNIDELEMVGNFGALLVANATVRLENIGSIVFKDTVGGQDAGVADIKSNVVSDGLFELENCGKVEFLNNNSELRGGAIAMGNYGGARPGDVFLSADRGDIIFKGNHIRGFVDPANPYLNAIRFNAESDIGAATELSHLTLRAQEGRSILFYDPITSVESSANKSFKMKLSFNETPAGGDVAYTGIIRFDGSEAEKTIIRDSVITETDQQYKARLEKSRYSDFQGDTTLYGGSLILTNKVIFGRKLTLIPPVETSFTLTKGILEITNESQLHAFNVSFSGLDAILRMDNSSLIKARNVTAANGLSFDVDYWLNNTNANVVINARNASFSGVIGMQDGIDTYSDNQWANTLSFKLLDASGITNLNDQLSGIQSNTSGSSVIDDPYQYKGEWSYEWVGTQLIATWTPKAGGGITDVLPELEGNIISNSMWSSASNVKSLSNTALANANILRMESSLSSNFWVKGIGDFAYDDSSAELDGYSYQGGGYAAGADFKVGAKSIVGVAFGQLMGDNKSELYTAKIKQESMMGTLYAAHLQTLNKQNSLLWTLAGTYGRTDNSMNTHYSDGQNSAGSWNNNAYFVEAKLEWRISPEAKSWTYKPFIGLEYTDVSLDSFTETGDKARSFGDGKYKNLALPIGMGVEHQSRFGEKTWLNSLSLAYVPDVYREAPSTQATRLSNGFSWKDQGSKPSIHTLRASINSSLQLNAAWTAYLGYTFEAREGSSYHNVNTGVSYSF